MVDPALLKESSRSIWPLGVSTLKPVFIVISTFADHRAVLHPGGDVGDVGHRQLGLEPQRPEAQLRQQRRRLQRLLLQHLDLRHPLQQSHPHQVTARFCRRHEESPNDKNSNVGKT